MPIDYKRYPKNWKELRSKVIERARNRCEFCGVHNHEWIYRDKEKDFVVVNKRNLFVV